MRHRPSRILRYAVLSSKKVTYQKAAAEIEAVTAELMEFAR